MINKRRHKRIPLAGSVVLEYAEGNSQKVVNALANDISLSGIGVYADEPVPSEEHITATVHFISVDSEMHSETLQGTVIYWRKVGDFFFIGIEFDDLINPERNPLLFKHLGVVLAF